MTGTPGISNLFGSLRFLGQHQQSVATSLERLATGKKINRASDDPSGLIVAENLKGRQLSINKLLERYEYEESRLGATEGGLSVLQEQVLELSGLVVSGANTGALSDEELEAKQLEINSVIDGINQIVTNTFFNGDQLLLGNDASALGLGDLAQLLAKDPEAAQDAVDQAVDAISKDRAAIGTRINEIDSKRNVLLEEFEANAGVLSSVEDTDYAAESAELIRAQILEQSALKAVEIDRQQAGRVLDLIASVPPVKPNDAL